MSNTIMSAKNTFTEGLIMDFAPDNTQATCLTSALNATLLTFNGNEMSLQNDMGNGRVETARLPDGYIPVGTCEFGDIIYIVSYNPILDKSQIGCFPSPERNISSQELGGTNQILKSSDFQEFSTEGKLTGKLNNTVVKKVLVSKNINPGDKYVIYTSEKDVIKNNYKDGYLSIGDKKGYVKLSVVSIEEDGKLTKLDTDTVQYDYTDFKYFIQTIANTNATEIPDIDSYRNALQSGWSIFNSKVSGKLAILAELEMPETFSCEYSLRLSKTETKDDRIKYKTYTIVLEPSYTGDVSPTKICIGNTGFLDATEEKYSLGNTVENSSCFDIGENEEYEIGTVTIPYEYEETGKLITSPEFVYTLEIMPAMPYGYLDHLKLTFYIDFNLVGTGTINLTNWRYHNQDNVSILSYGIDAYLKDQQYIEKIVMHFYDNQGLVAEYLLEEEDINSGIYTEYLGLNGNAINAALSKYKIIKDENGNEERILIKHKKTDEVFERTNDDSNDLKGDDNYYCINEVDEDGEFKPEDGKLKYHLNDAGVLYSNFLYAVKIMIYVKGDEPLVINEYRWFWTTPMYNEYYYSVKDFDILKFEMPLEADVLYETANNYVWKTKEINNLEKSITDGIYNSYSANVQYVDNSDNINVYIQPRLKDDYGCFKLYKNYINEENEEVDYFQNFSVSVYLGNNTLTNINANQYDFSGKETNVTEKDFLSLNNTTITEYNIYPDFKYLNDSQLNIQGNKDIQNGFNISYTKAITEYLTDENTKFGTFTVGLDKCYYQSQDNKVALPLTLQAIIYNKAYTQEEYSTHVDKPVYAPIINDLNDLDSLGLTYTNDGELGFNIAMNLCYNNNRYSATSIVRSDGLKFDTPNKDDLSNVDNTSSSINTSTSQSFIENVWSKFENQMPTFFPVYIGGNMKTSYYVFTTGSTAQNISTSWPTRRVYNHRGGYVNGRLTLGDNTFDIKDSGELNNITDANHITFLGMRYKDGMTLLNTAMVDGHNDSPAFIQKDNMYGVVGATVITYYPNLAYQLYILFSNIYHKNKRVEDKEINIKNFVRNSQYESQLVKTIYYYLKFQAVTDDIKADVAFYGMSFSDYVEKVKSHLEKGITDANVSILFTDYLHKSDLQINVKSEPMSFLKSEQEAYFLRNGNLIGTNNLSSNQFYIYNDQNSSLEVMQSKSEVTFNNTTVEENYKYLTGLDLTEYKTQIKSSITDKDKELNEFLIKVVRYINSNPAESVRYNYTNGNENEKSWAFSRAIADATVYLRDVSSYVSSKMRTLYIDPLLSDYKYKIMPYPEQCEGIVTIENGYDANGYYFALTTPQLTESNYKDVFKTQDSAICVINQNLNLVRYFDYDNGLVLNPASSHNTFGISAGGVNHGYVGFLKDVILDTNYQVK